MRLSGAAVRHCAVRQCAVPFSGKLAGWDLDSGAGLLHRLTSYEPGRAWDVPPDDPRVRHDLVPNDWATVPPPTKEYPARLPRLALPRDLPDPGVPATAVLAGVPCPRRPLDAAQLGRVLFLGAGVVRTGERHGHRFLFRASGSAGARFASEVYASTRDVAGVPDGVYWYDPVAHALVPVALWPAIATSVASWKTTYAGTPPARAVSSRQLRNRSSVSFGTSARWTEVASAGSVSVGTARCATASRPADVISTTGYSPEL